MFLIFKLSGSVVIFTYVITAYIHVCRLCLINDKMALVNDKEETSNKVGLALGIPNKNFATDAKPPAKLKPKLEEPKEIKVNKNTNKAKADIGKRTKSRKSVQSQVQSLLFDERDPLERLERPLVGCCEARLAVMTFAVVTALTHLFFFLITLSLGYSEYQRVTSDAGQTGAAAADVAFEFLCILPIMSIVAGAYSSKFKYSITLIFWGTMASLLFSLLMCVIHFLDLYSLASQIDKPKHPTSSVDKPSKSERDTYGLLLAFIVAKCIIQCVLYTVLATSTLKHWNYLQSMEEDMEEDAEENEMTYWRTGAYRKGGAGAYDRHYIPPTMRAYVSDSDATHESYNNSKS